MVTVKGTEPKVLYAAIPDGPKDIEVFFYDEKISC